jgi:hypothetical protein
MDTHVQYFVADDNHVLFIMSAFAMCIPLTALQYAALFSAGGGGVSGAGGRA